MLNVRNGQMPVRLVRPLLSDHLKTEVFGFLLSISLSLSVSLCDTVYVCVCVSVSLSLSLCVSEVWQPAVIIAWNPSDASSSTVAHHSQHVASIHECHQARWVGLSRSRAAGCGIAVNCSLCCCHREWWFSCTKRVSMSVLAMAMTVITTPALLKFHGLGSSFGIQPTHTCSSVQSSSSAVLLSWLTSKDSRRSWTAGCQEVVSCFFSFVVLQKKKKMNKEPKKKNLHMNDSQT